MRLRAHEVKNWERSAFTVGFGPTYLRESLCGVKVSSRWILFIDVDSYGIAASDDRIKQSAPNPTPLCKSINKQHLNNVFLDRDEPHRLPNFFGYAQIGHLRQIFCYVQFNGVDIRWSQELVCCLD